MVMSMKNYEPTGVSESAHRHPLQCLSTEEIITETQNKKTTHRLHSSESRNSRYIAACDSGAAELQSSTMDRISAQFATHGNNF